MSIDSRVIRFNRFKGTKHWMLQRRQRLNWQNLHTCTAPHQHHHAQLLLHKFRQTPSKGPALGHACSYMIFVCAYDGFAEHALWRLQGPTCLCTQPGCIFRIPKLRSPGLHRFGLWHLGNDAQPINEDFALAGKCSKPSTSHACPHEGNRLQTPLLHRTRSEMAAKPRGRPHRPDRGTI